jgi:hypothetical protein
MEHGVFLQEFPMPTPHGPILATLLLVLAAGCGTRMETSLTVGGGAPIEGSGKIAREDRKVEGFQRVTVRNGIEVVVAVTGTESVTVEADDNLLPLVQTTVEHGTLQVGVKGSLKTRNPLRVQVAAKHVEGLTAESSAKVSSKHLKGDNLALSASSSGQVTANNVDAKQLKVSVSSSGSVTADGRTDRQEIEASSSGHYDGSKLVSRASRVTCSGAASTVLHATEEVSGSASSAGSVRYSGSPGKVAVSTNSAASVQAAGK